MSIIASYRRFTPGWAEMQVIRDRFSIFIPLIIVSIFANFSNGFAQDQTSIYVPLVMNGQNYSAASKPGGGGSYPAYDLFVNQTGVYRITYEYLKSAGLNLNGVRSGDLAVTNKGITVPIRVSTTGKFGPGQFIEFFGEGLNTLYTKTNVYTIKVDARLASRVRLDTVSPPAGAIPATYFMQDQVVDNNNHYDYMSPTGDPWYDTEMQVYANQPRTWDFPFFLSSYSNSSGTGKLSVTLYGLTEMVSGPDNHVQVKVNGNLVADQLFDTLPGSSIVADLPPGVLQSGSNTLSLTLPADTGAPWDIVYLERFSVNYPRTFQLENNRLTFTASAPAFQVSGFPSKDALVYRKSVSGMARLTSYQWAGVTAPYSLTFAGTGNQDTYYVVAAGGLLSPASIQAQRPKTDITKGLSNYLIISHPYFINNLATLVQSRQADGFTVRVVNVEDIYSQYSYGIFDPQALKDYIKYAATFMGAQYVLLVGADTYDYFDYLKTGKLSFIPTLYRKTDAYVAYAPSDPSFADIDDNGRQDLAIGRFPVRTTAELDALIYKTLSYINKNYSASAIFSADKEFTQDSDKIANKLPPGWQVNKNYLDQKPLNEARTTLIDTLNSGVALATYVGHSEPSVWSYAGLFYSEDAASLTNAGRSAVVVQFGCSNTYFVDPTFDAFSQTFLLYGDRGAAALLGSTSISYATANEKFGEYLTEKLTTPGMTIGMALKEAKKTYGSMWGGSYDIHLAFSLMGDPALVIQP